METEELLARWHVLLNEPGNVIALRDVLQERLDILHRLNELGTRTLKASPFLPQWRQQTLRPGKSPEQARLVELHDATLKQRRKDGKFQPRLRMQ